MVVRERLVGPLKSDWDRTFARCDVTDLALGQDDPVPHDLFHTSPFQIHGAAEGHPHTRAMRKKVADHWVGQLDFPQKIVGLNGRHTDSVA